MLLRQSACSLHSLPHSQEATLPRYTEVGADRMSHSNWTHMLRSNHLVQTVRTTFPVVQTVPFTFPLGISHLHLWRSGDGFSVSVCTAGKKMASLIRKSFIIALQLQLCTARPRTRYSRITHAPALLVRGFVSSKKGSRSMGEEKKEGKNNNNN